MTQAKMISILVNSQPGRKQEQKITLSEKKLRNFFSDKYTAEDMEKCNSGTSGSMEKR